MKKEIYNCEKAKQIDLLDYLQKLGYRPSKIRGRDYWFLSPFRNEKTASFKVNCNKNLWFDFALGKGGTIIDFGIRYFKCSIQELLLKLCQETETGFSFHQPIRENKIDSGEILISVCRAITDPTLRQYLHERNIPLIIANRFCSEIEFELYGKRRIAIGFKNDLGGYELRSENFKGSSSPKSTSIFKNNPSTISVFEGCFDFLSFQTAFLFDRKLIHELPKNQGSYLILNSLSFLDTSRELMEKYRQIDLYLDRDESGLKATSKALEWSENYRDKSHIYDAFKDLNEYHIEQRKDEPRQSRFYKYDRSNK
jgi:hypothetical protein